MTENLIPSVGKEAKLSFLKKLSSNKFMLNPDIKTAPCKTFDSLDFDHIYDPVTYHTSTIAHEEYTGLFKCTETGEILTLDQVLDLRSQYMLFGCDKTDDDRPTYFICVNPVYPKEMFLDALLTKKI